MSWAATIVWALAVAASRPVPGSFETELFPGEGIPEFRAVKTTSLALRAEPLKSAAVVGRVKVKSGERVEYDRVRHRVITPGQIEIVGPVTIKGRVLGPISFLSKDSYYSGSYPTATFKLTAGRVIEYLQYRAEGTDFLRIDGQVVDAYEYVGKPELWRTVRQPTTELWIHVLFHNRPAGWLLLQAEQVKEAARHF